MTQEERFSRLELKVDRLQDQAHAHHLELLSHITRANDAVDDEINKINLKLKEHDGHFTMMVRFLGLGSILGSWIGLRDWFGGK